MLLLLDTSQLSMWHFLCHLLLLLLLLLLPLLLLLLFLFVAATITTTTTDDDDDTHAAAPPLFTAYVNDFFVRSVFFTSVPFHAGP